MKCKPIKGFDGYLICCDGRVISLMTKHKPIILKSSIRPRGYEEVGLVKNRKRHSKTVHRLVAEAFIPNPKNKPQVNHIDGDKTNNLRSNLEWNTRSENIRHSVLIGLKKGVRGSKSNLSKLEEYQVLEIRHMYSLKIKQKDIANKFNVSIHTVSAICNRKRWQHI